MSHFSNANVKKECVYSAQTSNICRACLAEDLPLESLSKLVEPSKTTLLEMMMSCTELQVSISDFFPQNLCCACIEQLCNAYNFKLKCVRSFDTLKRQMQLEYIQQGIENEDSIDIKCELDIDDNRFEVTSIITDYVEAILDEPPVSPVTNNTNRDVKIEEETDKNFETRLTEINFIRTTKESEIQRRTTDEKNSDSEDCIENKGRKLKIYTKKHVCTDCNKKFDSVLRLENHKSSAHSKKTFLCSDCGHVCKSSTGYQAHLASHSNDRPFVCAECGNKYKSQLALQVHRRNHTGERRYTCEHCGNKFITSNSMKSHIKTHHTVEKQYECSLCFMAFKHSASLTYHMRHHTGEKPYPCSECDMSFKSHNERKRHFMKHTGEKKYTCTICSKRFARSYHLTQHMVTHTGERKHVCKLCTKAFTQAHVLRSHMSKYHMDGSGKLILATNYLK